MLINMSKIIVVPRNKEAEIALDYDTATPDQIIELKLKDKEFENLWDKGIIFLINKISIVILMILKMNISQICTSYISRGMN